MSCSLSSEEKMIGRVLDIEKDETGRVVELGIEVEEFCLHFMVVNGHLHPKGFECYGHSYHEPRSRHQREARRVALGFLADNKKRQEAIVKQSSLIPDLFPAEG